MTEQRVKESVEAYEHQVVPMSKSCCTAFCVSDPEFQCETSRTQIDRIEHRMNTLK